MNRRRAGFTLVELMTVVALIGIMAALAVMSVRRHRSTNDADAWANALRNMVNQARRRAVATGKTYMIDVRAKSAQWCQVTDPAPNCTTTTTACPNTDAGMENGGAVYAASEAVTTTPTRLYFGSNGTADSDYGHVRCLTAPPAGATLKTSAQERLRRVVILGASGRPRILDTW
jgi:type II secretion system protein H